MECAFVKGEATGSAVDSTCHAVGWIEAKWNSAVACLFPLTNARGNFGGESGVEAKGSAVDSTCHAVGWIEVKWNSAVAGLLHAADWDSPHVCQSV